MKRLKTISLIFISIVLLSSCSFRMNGMSNSNAQLNLTSDDVEISEQLEVSAVEKLVLGVDWKRIGKKEIGQVRRKASGVAIPVIGTNSFSRAEAYALHKLLEENPGLNQV